MYKNLGVNTTTNSGGFVRKFFLLNLIVKFQFSINQPTEQPTQHSKTNFVRNFSVSFEKFLNNDSRNPAPSNPIRELRTPTGPMDRQSIHTIIS